MVEGKRKKKSMPIELQVPRFSSVRKELQVHVDSTTVVAL